MKKIFIFVVCVTINISLMARDVCISIPDNIDMRVVMANTDLWGYRTHINDPGNPNRVIPNPETRMQFFNRYIKEMLAQNVWEWEATNAAANERIRALEESKGQVQIP